MAAMFVIEKRQESRSMQKLTYIVCRLEAGSQWPVRNRFRRIEIETLGNPQPQQMYVLKKYLGSTNASL